MGNTCTKQADEIAKIQAITQEINKRGVEFASQNTQHIQERNTKEDDDSNFACCSSIQDITTKFKGKIAISNCCNTVSSTKE